MRCLRGALREPRAFVFLLMLSVFAACGGDEDAIDKGTEATKHHGISRPRLREFAFVSRPQDRAAHVCTGDAQTWRTRGAALIFESKAGDGLRCLQLAIRLGCKTAHVFQDMSVARQKVQDLGGAVADARRAVLLSGCSQAAVGRRGDDRCTSPELLLNLASLVDKIMPSATALTRILQILRGYISVACHKDATGALSCHARGAIAAIVELWRLGQLSFRNWDTYQQDLWLLTAAVDADVQRCRADDTGKRFSVVQPWEVHAKSFS